MENRRRQKWDNCKRSQNRKPPRGSWQPMVPSWEKEFCRVVGALDWETLLQMKKFTHLYENVNKWNDSAGKDAFSNAKKRFWAEMNGLKCDSYLPDPDLYIDKIDWNSEIAPDSEVESNPVTSNEQENHDPVVIFGDALLPKLPFPATGWGDEYDEENFEVTLKCSPVGDPWEERGVDLYDNSAPIGCHGYGSGPNNDWGWEDTNNDGVYEVGHNTEYKVPYGDYRSSRYKGNYRYRQHEKRHSSRACNSFGSGHRAAIAVGQTWNR